VKAIALSKKALDFGNWKGSIEKFSRQNVPKQDA
jgi:hypothetical protein